MGGDPLGICIGLEIFIIRVTLYVFYVEFCNVIQFHSSQLLLSDRYKNPTGISPLTWSFVVKRMSTRCIIR